MHKLILNIVLTVTLSLFGFGWLIDQYINNSIDDEVVDIQPQNNMLNGFVNHLQDVPAEQLQITVEKLAEHFNAKLAIENKEDFAFEDKLLMELNSSGIQIASDVEEYYLRSVPNHPNALLKLTTEIDVEQGSQFDVILTLLLYFCVSIAVVLWMLPLIRRLTKLTDIANKFGKGDLSVRVVPAKFSQINVLENSFNKMASQIEHLIEENRLLANSLSHDLRTPVSCFRFGLDASLGETDVVQKDVYLTRMEKDLENIEGMLNAFLDYASMERKGMQLDFQATNLRDFVEAIVKDLEPISKQKDKQLLFYSEVTSSVVKLDNVWVYRAFANLITNAVSYAKSQVSVFLTTEYDSSRKVPLAACYICDDGPGIPDSELEKVFDAFVRLDPSRKRNGKNFGLGLAIVKRVTDWHNFKVVFLNKSDVSEQSALFKEKQIVQADVRAMAKISMPLISE
jgi:signal transduction histidine kinase